MVIKFTRNSGKHKQHTRTQVVIQISWSCK